MRYINKLKLPPIRPSRRSAAVFVIIFAVLGTTVLIGSYAATPYVTIEPEQGALSNNAVIVSGDPSASNSSYIKFGISASNVSLTPMQLINRRSDVKVYPASAGVASDGNYATSWSGNTGTITYDVSAVPTINRSQIILAWYTALDDALTANTYPSGSCGHYQRPIPKNYTIQINSAAGGSTSPPTAGWVTVQSITSNIYYSRQHLINADSSAPFNWIRMNITGAVTAGGSSFDINIDLADASQGINSQWIFFGDSITNQYAGHNQVTGGGDNIGPPIADLLATIMGDDYHLITENASAACTRADQWTGPIDEELARYPGKYVSFNLGSNDCNTTDTGVATNYKAAMRVLADKTIASGKIPVMPHIPWVSNGNQAGINACNKAIDSLVSEYSNKATPIIIGPDLYGLLLNKPNWLGDGLHPNRSGQIAIRCAWAYNIARNVYNKIPAAIPSCNGYATP